MTTPIVLRILAPAGLLVLGACAAPMASADHYEQGKRHLGANEMGLALQSFRAALHDEGRSVRVLNALGAVYDAMGRSEDADPYYREALTIDPGDIQTLNNLGYSLLLRDRPREAEPLLIMAADGAPDDPLIARNLDMAESRIAAEPEMPAAEPAATDPAPPPPPPGPPVRLGPWVERSAQATYTLRTDLVAFKKAVELDADPALALPALAQIHAPVRHCAVEVANGNGRNGAAARFRQRITPIGFQVVSLTNADSFDMSRTVIRHAPGCGEQAARLAMTLPIPARIEAAAASPGITVVIGRDLLPFDRAPTPSTTEV